MDKLPVDYKKTVMVFLIIASQQFLVIFMHVLFYVLSGNAG